MINRTTQTVSELNKSIKLLLENGLAFVTVTGEISNLSKPYSGHQYFALKDSKSQLKCVLFKMQQRYLSKNLSNGTQILCHGRISVYEPRGEYQLIVDTVDFIGEGDLQLTFEKLKAKLSAEGLFDSDKKQKLPFLPNKIALVSSPQGAAVHDFLKVSSSRCPSVPIDIYPVRVQGETAASEIIDSINYINFQNSAEVIVICRGGGSIEDLWSFNDEHLARSIFSSSIPVVAAIGHEIDFTIADFTADCRAPTPTAAVEYVMPDTNTINDRVQMSIDRISQAINHKISLMSDRLSFQKRLLSSPIKYIFNLQLQIDHLRKRFINSFLAQLESKQHKLSRKEDTLFRKNPVQQLEEQKLQLHLLCERLIHSISTVIGTNKARIQKDTTLLHAVSPLAVLKRGYAIVNKLPEQSVVRSTENIKDNDLLKITLAEGELNSKVVPGTVTKV